MKFIDFDVCKDFINKDKTKIIRYIELVYNKESILNGIQNLKERKNEACRQAKLDLGDSSTKKIMNLRNEEVNTLIFHYLSIFQNSNSFHQLCTDQQLFWSIQQILMKPIQTDDEDEIIEKYKKRGALSESADQIKMRINRLYSEIFFSEDFKEIALTQVRQMNRPEQIVKQKDS